MVAKISSSNNLYGALSYNQNKVDDEHAKVIFTNKMIEKADGYFDISTCLQSFENYLLANRRTEKPVIHIKRLGKNNGVYAGVKYFILCD